MSYSYINKNPEILVVDDSPVHIMFVAEVIRNKNYRVRALRKSTQIFDAIEKGIPDLILLDVLMPEMDGFEICTRLKNDERYSAIPIIFLTAVNDSENIVKGFEAGAQDYVSKPVNPRELIARIETHLNLKKRTDKLIEAYHEIENFNHMVSHDLKTPIWSISKLIGFLKDSIDSGNDQDIAELMDIMSEKTGETVKLIEKYAQLTKLSSTAVNTDEVDMNRLADDIAHEIIKTNPQKEIVFNKSDLPVVYGDRILLGQVLANIFSNSVKYSQKGKSSIITMNCTKKGDEYLFSIEDNGVGFDMKYAENLFEFFVRLHSRKEYEGTGIGLAIVKKIIKLHGGDIWVTSQVDKGTVIYFTLPVEVQAGSLPG